MSMSYRRRLGEGISDLEETIHRYMEENEPEYVAIGGYGVARENRSLIVNELPPVDADLLSLPFYVAENSYKFKET